MIINTSIAAMRSLNDIDSRHSAAAIAMQRLSSGLRINRAADDPSGLAIVSGMRAQIGGLNVCMHNIQDGINMLRTAEGGIREISDMTQRIRDLCVRGANEATLTASDLAKIQAEIESLKNEINRTGQATKFNTKSVTSNYEDQSSVTTNLNSTTVNHNWAGPAPPAAPGDAEYDEMADRVVRMTNRAVEKVFGMLGISPDPSFNLTINFSQIDGNGGALATGGGAPGNMVMNFDVEDFLDPDGPGPLSELLGYDPAVHGFTMEMVVVHEMTHAVFIALGGGGGSAWGQEMLAAMVSGEADRRITGNEAGVLAAIGGGLTSAPADSNQYAEAALAGKFIVEKFGASRMREIAQEVIDGSDFDTAVETVLADTYASFADFETAADAWSNDYINNGKHLTVDTNGMAWTSNPPNEVQSNSWYLQVGADNGDSFRKDAQTPWGVGGALDYLLFVDVANADSAQRSISVADKAIGALSNALSLIGRQERVLNHIANDTAAQIIGVENSKSAILDADIASEALSLTKENILAQSATSVLAQSSSLSGSTVLDLIDMSLA